MERTSCLFRLGLVMLSVVNLLCVGATSWPLYATAHSTGPLARRALQQTETETSVLIADFESLADADVSLGNLVFNETLLTGNIPIASGTQQEGWQETQFGSYDLSPKMVAEIFSKISEQMPYVTPEDSQVLGPIQFPGLQLEGKSVIDDDDPTRLRVPTIYAPFRTGTVFDFGTRPEGVAETLPGVALRLSNVTIIMENVTWADVVSGDSGLERFFLLQDNARVCFSNSILVLGDCTDFTSFDLICCKANEGCNVKYSRQVLLSISEETNNSVVAEVASSLTPIHCYDQLGFQIGSEAGVVADSGSGDGSRSNQTLIIAASVVTVVVTTFFAGLVLLVRRHQKARSDSDGSPGTKYPLSRMRQAPISSTQSTVKSEPEPPAKFKGKRDRNGLRSKVAITANGHNGYTEHALLDRDSRPVDFAHTTSSPTDHSPQDDLYDDHYSTAPNLAQVHNALGNSPTHASGASPLKVQHRARSRDELRTYGDSAAGATRRNGTALQKQVGDTVAQHVHRLDNDRGSGHSISPSRGGTGDSGRVAGRPNRSFLGQQSGELTEQSEREKSHRLTQLEQGEVQRGGSPSRGHSGGGSPQRINGRSGLPPRRITNTRDSAHSPQADSHMHGGNLPTGGLPRVGSAPGGRSGTLARPRRSGESRESGNQRGASPKGTRGSNMHADHASSAPLDVRAHTYDISNIGAHADRDVNPQEFLAPPAAASDFATGTRTEQDPSRTATHATHNGMPAAGAGALSGRSTESRTQHAAQHTETIEARASYMATPGKGATVEEKRRFVLRQLDALGDGAVVLGKFVLLDASQRCHGGQAVVQFAHGKLDRQDYAIKFFLSRKGFEAEEALYRHTTLGQFLPQVTASCPEAASSIRDPWGRALPACMVMERGEALDLWMERAQPDKYMAFSMIANMAERVCELHARGWVHRDLKPANIMWLPRTNSWTVIDFGCAAPRGAQAPLSFTLGYAAPEVAIALADGSDVVTAECAMDAWAIGVIAFELLTGRSAFKMFRGKQDVVEQLVGNQDLPWEGSRLTPNVLRKLGAHKKDVLGLLHRDPEERLTLYQFLNSCSQMLNGTESLAPFAPTQTYEWTS